MKLFKKLAQGVQDHPAIAGFGALALTALGVGSMTQGIIHFLSAMTFVGADIAIMVGGVHNNFPRSGRRKALPPAESALVPQQDKTPLHARWRCRAEKAVALGAGAEAASLAFFAASGGQNGLAFAVGITGGALALTGVFTSASIQTVVRRREVRAALPEVEEFFRTLGKDRAAANETRILDDAEREAHAVLALPARVDTLEKPLLTDAQMEKFRQLEREQAAKPVPVPRARKL